MRLFRPITALLLVALALTFSACAAGTGAAPTLTPDPALALTAAALFPTLLPAATVTPTPVARGDDSEQIAALLGQMENAVLRENRAAYLALVDLADPVFALEHTRWVEDWAGPPIVSRFDLTLRNLTIDGDTATGDLTMAWTTRSGFDTPSSPAQVSRGADFPARFTRGDDEAWRYAGEAWAVTLETEHFRVRAMPGLEATAQAALALLPDVYTYVTSSMGHTPGGVQEIKLYDNAWDMVATIALSLPEIRGWNEPGESLKLVADSSGEGLDAYVLAHEYTHFVYFDLAGTTHGHAPWWLVEGQAVYVGGHFLTLSDQNNRLRQVQEWATRGRLVDWDSISDFERTPEDLWPYVYPQGYAMVRYVAETYGQAALNAWVSAMAGELELAEATRSALGVSFAELDAAFRAWLVQQ